MLSFDALRKWFSESLVKAYIRVLSALTVEGYFDFVVFLFHRLEIVVEYGHGDRVPCNNFGESFAEAGSHPASKRLERQRVTRTTIRPGKPLGIGVKTFRDETVRLLPVEGVLGQQINPDCEAFASPKVDATDGNIPVEGLIDRHSCRRLHPQALVEAHRQIL